MFLKFFLNFHNSKLDLICKYFVHIWERALAMTSLCCEETLPICVNEQADGVGLAYYNNNKKAWYSIVILVPWIEIECGLLFLFLSHGKK
jgi:hypothetical protein